LKPSSNYVGSNNKTAKEQQIPRYHFAGLSSRLPALWVFLRQERREDNPFFLFFSVVWEGEGYMRDQSYVNTHANLTLMAHGRFVSDKDKNSYGDKWYGKSIAVYATL
jgi:hypothetical protein